MGPAVRWFLSLFKKGNLWLSTEQLQQWVYCNVAKKWRGTKTKKLWLSCRQFFFITSSYWLSLVFLHVSQTETKKKTVASNNALQLKFFLTQSISWNIILIQFYTKNKQTNKKKSTRNWNWITPVERRHTVLDSKIAGGYVSKQTCFSHELIGDWNS